MAVCQALLTGVDEGRRRGAGDAERRRDQGSVQDAGRLDLASTILVGYPSEDPKGGGQRPRPPFEEQYYEGAYGTPFRRDDAVVAELKAANMIQEPAKPNDPKRIEEIKKLAEKYGLPM